MEFTFGIITDGRYDNWVNQIIDSIEEQNIHKYQVIVVGNSNINRANTKVIRFCEEPKPAWITRKKNIITEQAKYNDIVYMHDYVKLMPNWYAGFVKFDQENPNWHISMNKIINYDGTRYRDWVFWDHPSTGCPGRFGMPKTLVLAPYDYKDTNYLYISGAYWVARKVVMSMYPLDENLSWGQGEDVKWSFQIRDMFRYQMNQYSSVKLLKQKDVAAREPILGELL